MFQSGACYLDLYAYDEAVQDWRHMGPIGGGFGGDDGGTPSIYTKKNTTYLLYLPVRATLLDSAVSAVGVPTGSYLAGTPAQNALMAHAAVSGGAPAAGDTAPILRGSDAAIVWYGTSIQQGGVASRAGE